MLWAAPWITHITIKWGQLLRIISPTNERTYFKEIRNNISLFYLWKAPQVERDGDGDGEWEMGHK